MCCPALFPSEGGGTFRHDCIFRWIDAKGKTDNITASSQVLAQKSSVFRGLLECEFLRDPETGLRLLACSFDDPIVAVKALIEHLHDSGAFQKWVRKAERLLHSPSSGIWRLCAPQGGLPESVQKLRAITEIAHKYDAAGAPSKCQQAAMEEGRYVSLYGFVQSRASLERPRLNKSRVRSKRHCLSLPSIPPSFPPTFPLLPCLLADVQASVHARVPFGWHQPRLKPL